MKLACQDFKPVREFDALSKMQALATGRHSKHARGSRRHAAEQGQISIGIASVSPPMALMQVRQVCARSDYLTSVSIFPRFNISCATPWVGLGKRELGAKTVQDEHLPICPADTTAMASRPLQAVRETA